MKKTIRLSLPAILILLFFTAAMPAPARAEGEKHFLWQVRTPTATVYLLGSVHLMKKEAYPLSPVIEDAFARSDTVAVEANINDIGEETLARLRDRGFYGENDSIANHVSRDTYAYITAEAARLGLDWEVRAFESPDLIQEAFEAGQCDGWSSDVSQLTGLRSAYPGGADALTILPEVFSKEPLGPAVRDGDSQWAQAVEWAVLATIQAEEFGISSENVDDFLESEDDAIRRFLGQPFGEDQTVLDPGIGLPADFAYQVISQVGNYAEIFERHLTPLGLERGVNALWTDGGIQYVPPYR